MTACICIRSHFHAIWSGSVKGHVQIWRSSGKWGEVSGASVKSATPGSNGTGRRDPGNH